ncbi:A-kinase anchor protein 13 isoform X4 [Numida meleagris]|uniref:A-kinase anchor protein 13 isoform X4 n=1 Tax=Numida meleagris TaxID=8996 RepID=UPI000B3E170C|nr:A-kinase anchor protein 13 isoform X4 [Numida meleagris]
MRAGGGRGGGAQVAAAAPGPPSCPPPRAESTRPGRLFPPLPPLVPFPLPSLPSRPRCQGRSRPPGPACSEVMKLNPQQAPLYGDSVITVQLTEEDKVEDDVVFYLIFTGSTVQHCTSTRKINPGSLETISPGHDCCETVKVALCASKEGRPVLVVAEESFKFIQDEAYDAAQFLATYAGNQQALNFTRFLDQSRPPAADVDILDEKVALAFRHLKLPAEWNVLGADQSLNENIPRETLMHFAVRQGLLRLTWFLLQQPGGRGALSIHNRDGATPVSLALERGYQKLHQLLTEEEATEPDSWSTLSHTVHTGDYCVKHHQQLDVYTLTAGTKEGTKASLESDIRQLQMHMQSHQHMSLRKRTKTALRDSGNSCGNGAEPAGHSTASSQSLGEMPGEGRKESPSDVLHLDSGLLSDQAHQEDECPNGSLITRVIDAPNGTQGLGTAESPECSCESKNTVTLCKKEEEGPASAQSSGTVSDENGCTVSPCAGVNGAVNLPSCGNTDEEAGMTSAGVDLDQAGLCSKDSTHQEVGAAEECAAESTVAVVETAGEAPASREGVDVAMGQTECRNCAGAADRAPGQRQVEDGMAETPATRTADPEEPLPAEEEPTSAAQPLLDGFNGTECAGEEDANVGAVPACDRKRTNGDTDVSVGLCKSGDNKETGVSGTDLVNNGFLESEGDACIKERQRVTASTGAPLPVVNGVKIPVCVPKHGPDEESQDSSESVEPEGQVEAGNTNGKSSSPSLEDSVETDGPDARSENGSIAGTNQSSEEPTHCQGSGDIAECTGEATGGSGAHDDKSVGTDTSSSGEGGSVDSADRAQEVASCCPPVDQTAANDEMGDKLKLDDTQGSVQERRLLPLEDASTFLAGKEPPKDEERAESAPGQGMPHPNAGDLAVGQAGDAAVAPPGQEAPLCCNDPGLPPCAKGAVCTEDNFVGTPFVIRNEESKQKQEVAAAGSAELAPPRSRERGGVAGVLEDYAGAPGPPEQSLRPHAEGETAKPELEASDSSQEQVLLEHLLAMVVKSSVGSVERPAASSDVGAGLKELGLDQAGTAEAGDSIMQGTGPAAGSNPCPDAGLPQERGPSLQHVSPRSSTPELKDASELEAPSLAFEAEEALQIAAITSIAGYEEEQEEMESVLPRATLQPIAEEPTCDSDSSSDTVGLGGDGDAAPAATAARGLVTAQPEGKQSQGTLEPTPSPRSSGFNAVESPEHVGVKSSVSADDASSLDKVPKMVKSFDAVVFAAETPSSPGLPAEGKVGPEPQPAVDVAAGLNGEADLRSSARKDVSQAIPGAKPATGKLEMKTEDEVDFMKDPRESAACEEAINRESWCSLEPCPDSSLLERKRTGESPECENFLEDGLSSVCASSQGVLKRGSGSESDFFSLPGDGMEDLVFGKQPEEEQSAGDVTSSSSSADDTVSLERNSSLGSDTSLPFPPAVSFAQPKDRRSLDGSCTSMVAVEGGEGELAGLGEKEEELDSITDVPAPSSVSRNSMRPLSPFRRHSWGPGKNATNEAEINQRSSMRVLGDGIKKPPIHRRSLSWCPSGVQFAAMGPDFNCRSYSLEGLAGDSGENKKPSANLEAASLSSKDLGRGLLSSNQRGSLVLLSEELEQGEIRGYDHQMHQAPHPQGFNFCTSSVSSPLTKSMSLMSISKPSLDSTQAFGGPAGSLVQSISEESSSVPSSKSGTKVSRTFSYLRNKMSSSKKSKEKEKDKEKTKEKDKDSKEKEKDKKTLNGHLFTATSVVAQAICYHCMKPFNKDSYYCANCNAIVHKGCKESFASCAKVKMKPQRGMLQAHDTSSLPTVTMRNKGSQPKERPRSAILAPDENTVTSIFNNRRSQQPTALSKSVSIQNIAGVGNDDSLIHTWKFLSQSTDSLHKISRVNESTESLVDEGADMNEGQLMGDLELDSKQLEAESWSQAVDSLFLQQQNRDVVKRQDVIYELMQTEMHHVRTLKIMNDVYSAGMLQELQYDQQVVDKIFPCLENLLHIHSQFFQRILERKKESLADKSEKNFVIKRIGDILVNQFSGENAERMKKTYGKFCGHHNEAVNYFKDLYSKDKRFQAFVKKKMSTSLVRRLGISECILLVTQRITKYPVLLQRILQYTTENEVEHEDLTQSLNLVKDVIAAVNSKVSNYEKKMRLDEIYNRTDSKSIMRMKSGQMFAREDLRHRKLIRDGPVSLKNAAGRLKEVQAVLLSDMLIFLQEKDQKYVFASLDQKSTVISLKKLIVREVAHEEKGLFLISMGVKDPEMVEVHASSKEERNGWIQIIQDTISTMDKDEDEGVPCESEFEKKLSDTRMRALKEQLQQKDRQILLLLEEKAKIFSDMADSSMQEDMPGSRLLFRANTEEAPKGEAIMKTAINEVELLQDLVNRNLGSTLVQQLSSAAIDEEGGVGPISLPKRAETFGGFDSHQMNASKGGTKDEGDDAQDLRRTESDGVLKKAGNANLMFILKRNSEQVLQSVTSLHKLLSALQGVVLQQDTYIEGQKLALSERALSRGFFRPTSLLEQEKQRNLEKQRQELANLKKQQAQHQEEKRRAEKECEAREKKLAELEVQLAKREEEIQKGWQELECRREELRQLKASYQLEMEKLLSKQKQVDKEREQLRKDMERQPQMWLEHDDNQVSNRHEKLARVCSQSSLEGTSKQKSPSFPKQGHSDAELSVSPKRNNLSRTHKEKSTSHLLSTTNQTNKAAEEQPQMPTRLFSLSKPKEKKEKKKKGRGHRSQESACSASEGIMLPRFQSLLGVFPCTSRCFGSIADISSTVLVYSHSSEAPPEGEEIFC